MSKKKKFGIAILIALLVMILACAVYVLDYSRATDRALACLEGTKQVQVTETETGLLLDGPGEETAMIFYPGGKVEYTSYLPLLSRLAEDGTDCFLLRVPLNLAVLDTDRAAQVLETYDYDHWYLAGHSLGGVVAADFAQTHDIDGLILLASYPTGPLDIRTLSLYGSEDGVLNQEKFREAEQYLPRDAVVEEIEGANHAQFGDYGEQEGDGTPSITPEEQQEITAEKIEEFVK